MRPRIEPGARHIGVHIDRALGNAEASKIMAKKRADAGAGLRWRHIPLHEMVGEIGKRVAQGRELPIEHGADFRPRGSKNNVVEAVNALPRPEPHWRTRMR